MSHGSVAIGFDPGLAITGYGVVRAVDGGLDILAGGVIRTDKGVARAERLAEIYTEARALIETYRPEGIAIEEVFLATNAKTAMRTSEARGVLLHAASGCTVRGYTPLQVKKRVTGYGRATKAQVQAMVKRLLCMAEIPKPDDMESKSLTPVLSGTTDQHRDYVLSGLVSPKGAWHLVFDGRYKLVRIEAAGSSSERQTLLFDLQEDPWEDHNIANAEPSIVARLNACLDRELSRA